jgi:eukaryotic-like serine/threonine-protein kinase
MMKPISRSGEGRESGAADDAPDSAVLPTRPVRTDAFQSGEVIAGKYVIDRVIGQGGVGIVLSAKHRELDEHVAIKFLRPEVQEKPEIVERFAREARALVRIKSEYAARVYDVGVVAGRGPYLVMEYLEGKNLADLLAASGPLPVKRAVEYVMQTCEALAWAHGAGIVHRDIKPENLFLACRADGTELVKVLDFGISKYALAGGALEDEPPPVQTRELLGSPLYMSPEQIRGARSVDHRTDIWSLGIVLYELMTGRNPFEGETVPAICGAVLEHEPPPLVKYMSNPAPGLQDVVNRCLQKDSTKRFQNVAELSVALLPYGPSLARVFAQRASGILRSAGQDAPLTVDLESSRPPPASLVGGMSFPTPQRVPLFGADPRVGATTANDPEALDDIRRSGRRARRTVVGVSLWIVALMGGGAVYLIHPELDAPSAPASVAAATPVMHHVALETEPAGARVDWRGQYLGDTPLRVVMPSGVHAIDVTKDGFLREELVVTVATASEDPRPLRFTLRPAASAEPLAAPKTSALAPASAQAPVPRASAPRPSATSPAAPRARAIAE